MDRRRERDLTRVLARGWLTRAQAQASCEMAASLRAESQRIMRRSRFVAVEAAWVRPSVPHPVDKPV